ncbi:hypothetical protein [Streptomyces adelaidensis]|uniref:hypothetical protein n=1 Tax=Streptomyces adelaidensis TaxID=2796465 RepID=UPI0019082465|nr:hypothetical protein [Streptomyces adelaidensis]
MAYPEAKVEFLLGGAYVDVTTDVYVRGRINITCGRKDRGSRPSPSRCRFYLKNSPEVRARYSPVNPTGEYYGLLLPNTVCRISVNPNGTQWYRFCGVIPDFVLDRNATDLDRWVAVDAFGLLYALQGGDPPAYNALRRHINHYGPLACWPLTDGSDARQGSEIVTGGEPMRAVGKSGSFFQGQPNWSRGDLAPWLSSVVQLPDNTRGQLTATMQPADVTSWAVDFFRSGLGGDDDTLTVYDTGPGTDADPLNAYIVVADRSANQLRLDVTFYGETGTGTSTLWAQDDPGIFDESPHMIRFVIEQSGAEIAWSLIIDGETVAFATDPTLYHPPTRLRYDWGVTTATADPSSLGYVTCWGDTAPDAADTWKAVLGNLREPAGRRIERLCLEEGIPLRVIGSLDDTPLMGPQMNATLMSLLEAAIAVDGSTLTDATDELALEIRTNRSKYSQGVSA